MLFSFAGTIASFIDEDWNLIERLVDFHCLDDNEHEGVHAATGFVRSASSRGGLNKIQGNCLIKLQVTYIYVSISDNNGQRLPLRYYGSYTRPSSTQEIWN
jgi:hypothetical protein